MPAGYSGTPLAKKLGIAPGATVAIANEPEEFRELLAPIPDDVVREVALPLGLVDNKVCAISDVWSGLRIVWRKERR